MSDQNTQNVDTPETAPAAPSEETTTTQPTAAESPAAESIVQPTVAAPENALIGDENLPEPRRIEVVVDTDSVPAQTTGPDNVVVTEVPVHETYVTVDEVITDPHSPLAVQIPDAGRGTLDLPIHALSNPKPEDVFAKASKDAEGDES